MEIDPEIFLVILLPLIQDWLSVTGESMCTLKLAQEKYMVSSTDHSDKNIAVRRPSDLW